MRIKFLAIVLAGGGFAMLSSPSFSHHGSNVVYDLTETITVSGTVTDFQFVNPHTLIFFDVVGDDGESVGWLAGMSSPTSLGPNEGWTRETLKPGDEISVTGNPARGGAASVWVVQVYLNGEPLLGQVYTG